MKLYGKNPVIERLKSNHQSIRKIFVEENHVEGAYIRKKAKQWGIPVICVPRSKILKMTRDINAQGILAEIEDFLYEDYDTLVDTILEQKGSLLFLDSLTDPQNLGAIIRSVASLGGFGLVLPSHDSVSVTESVLRIASGADNHIKVAKVSNLTQAIGEAKQKGFWVVGSVVEGGEELAKVNFSYPLALVVGSEQKGIRPVIQKQLDLAVTIPMAHQRLSLNVAHAATILCYEINKQRKLLG